MIEQFWPYSNVVLVLAVAASLAAFCWHHRRAEAKLHELHRRQEEELLRKTALLDTVLDNMPLAVFAKDARDGYKFNLLNRKAQEVFCLEAEKTLGRSDYDFFPKAEADFFRQMDESVVQGRKLVEIEEESVTTPKGTFTAHTLKMPIYENGKPSLLLGILEDVTEKIKARDELRRAKDEAEEASRAKSEFLANMSHELRTPLNSIIGMLRLLKERNLSEEETELIEIAFKSSANLLDIVNDILDLSKIEAREMVLENVGMDLFSLLNNTANSLAQFAEERGIVLSLQMEKKAFPYVLGDPTRMMRILINLIGNAVKYTEHGSVTIRAYCEKKEEGHITFRCEIIDTGIGIPQDKLSRIFDKFVQADTSTTRKYGGTGLGLAITKQLIDLMGGIIGVESTVGVGSTFWFSIPFATTCSLPDKKQTHETHLGAGTIEPSAAHILVAEDHPLNQMLVSKLMKRFGIGSYEIVGNGKDVLCRCEEANWDLILMDCFMPEINGYDATRRIREREQNTNRHTPIIAMTANAMVGEREKCLACGMDEYISKPISVDELKQVLSHWIHFKDKE